MASKKSAESASIKKGDSGSLHKKGDGGGLHKKGDENSVHTKGDDCIKNKKGGGGIPHIKVCDSSSHKEGDNCSSHKKEDDCSPHKKGDGGSTHIKGDAGSTHKKGKVKKGSKKPKTLGPPQISASNVYENMGAGRRRSSVMIEYYRDNYMGVESGEITDTHLKDMEDTFDLLDQDHDGKLTKTEIANLLRYMGCLKSDQDLDKMLEQIDTDHNGSIDINEFKKYIIDTGFLETLADDTCYEMMDAFNMFDKNKDGFIDKDELKLVLTSVGDKMPDDVAEQFLLEADRNGDGKIDYQEFCKHMGY